MKKLFILFGTLLIGLGALAFDPRNIDDRLIRSFEKNFPNATQVNWSELSASYMVSFVEGGIRSRILYLKDGTLVQSTRYYGAENLPFLIREKIRWTYPGKSIFGVTEVSTISQDGNFVIEYYLNLEDSRRWVKVKIDFEGNLTELERFRKAKQKVDVPRPAEISNTSARQISFGQVAYSLFSGFLPGSTLQYI